MLVWNVKSPKRPDESFDGKQNTKVVGLNLHSWAGFDSERMI